MSISILYRIRDHALYSKQKRITLPETNNEIMSNQEFLDNEDDFDEVVQILSHI